MSSAARRAGTLALAALALCVSCKKTTAPPGAPASSAADKVTPSRAEATGTAGAASAAIKLCEHGVPADQCTRCNPDLVAVFKELGDWCNEHGLPESHCRICNPKLTFATQPTPQDWCKEHAVPESKCTKCNPALIPKFIAAGDYCREHGFPESVCPYCHPELVKAAGQPAPQFPAPGTKVKLATAETARDAGLRTARVERRPWARTLEVVGQLAFNGNRLAQLSARGEALVMEVKVDVGDEVRAGQPLVVLASAVVGGHQAQQSAARARLETAQTALQRERGLAERGIVPRKNAEAAERELAAADAEYRSARASLAASGAAGSGTTGRYVLSSPFAGTVVARDAVVGKTAASGQVLIEVADLSTMWAELDVPEASAALVSANQPVTLGFEGMELPEVQAKITRLASSVDPHTRTVRARVELANADRKLKAGVFVRAMIQVSDLTPTLLVPPGAVQSAQGTSLVFVKKAEGVFDPVPVKVGARTAEGVEILEGLSPGAEIVTTGAFLLKTEVLKDSIGAGCCDEGGE